MGKSATKRRAAGAPGPATPTDIVPIAASVQPPLELEPAQPLELESHRRMIRLDLACGQSPREGFEGVDLLAPAARKVDLCRFPWPFESDSVDEIHCSHFIEHIPCREIEARDLVDPNPQTIERWVGVDMFFGFFDEVWRILKHEGKARIICPALRSNRAFQDPTHRRFVAAETFTYLHAPWREANKLDHYRVRCNFAGVCNHTLPAELTLLSQEAQQQRFHERWNQIHDWIADLVAIKREEKRP